MISFKYWKKKEDNLNTLKYCFQTNWCLIKKGLFVESQTIKIPSNDSFIKNWVILNKPCRVLNCFLGFRKQKFWKTKENLQKEYLKLLQNELLHILKFILAHLFNFFPENYMKFFKKVPLWPKEKHESIFFLVSVITYS